jgi:hypothetical protein
MALLHPEIKHEMAASKRAVPEAALRRCTVNGEFVRCIVTVARHYGCDVSRSGGDGGNVTEPLMLQWDLNSRIAAWRQAPVHSAVSVHSAHGPNRSFSMSRRPALDCFASSSVSTPAFSNKSVRWSYNAMSPSPVIIFRLPIVCLSEPSSSQARFRATMMTSLDFHGRESH